MNQKTYCPSDGRGPVLDVCCGSKTFWFNRQDKRAVFMDNRQEIYQVDQNTPGTNGRRPIIIWPDINGDFTDIPFASETFYHVVFDPPHCRRLEAAGITRKYGVLVPGWEEMLRAGFAECFRVLKPGGTLIFKWCSIEIPLDRVLQLTPEIPLYGHRTGRKAQTHWVAFIKT
jgi:SAM-dependent methyltransferase